MEPTSLFLFGIHLQQFHTHDRPIQWDIFYGDPFQITFSNKNCCIWAWRTKWLTSECKYCIDFWDSTKSTHTHRHHSLADISCYSIQGSREWKLEWGLRFKQREKQVESSKPWANTNNIVWRFIWWCDVGLTGDTVCLYMSAGMSVFGTEKVGIEHKNTFLFSNTSWFCYIESVGICLLYARHGCIYLRYSNIVKYCWNLKWLFSILIYFV